MMLCDSVPHRLDARLLGTVPCWRHQMHRGGVHRDEQRPRPCPRRRCSRQSSCHVSHAGERSGEKPTENPVPPERSMHVTAELYPCTPRQRRPRNGRLPPSPSPAVHHVAAPHARPHPPEPATPIPHRKGALRAALTATLRYGTGAASRPQVRRVGTPPGLRYTAGAGGDRRVAARCAPAAFINGGGCAAARPEQARRCAAARNARRTDERCRQGRWRWPDAFLSAPLPPCCVRDSSRSRSPCARGSGHDRAAAVAGASACQPDQRSTVPPICVATTSVAR